MTAPLLAAVALLAFAQTAVAEGNASDAEFLADLRKPVVLINYAAPKTQGRAPLSAGDRASLSAAKKVMVEFLRSFSTFDPDPLSFLSSPLRSRYESGRDLYAEKFGAEKLIEVEVYDYSIGQNGPDDIALYVVLTDTTEGTDVRHPTAFGLSRKDDRWLIDRIGQEVGFKQ